MINYQNCLEQRRRQLKMPYSALARRSGISLSTVKRILGSESGASFTHVAAIASAMSMETTFLSALDLEQARERQARDKAEWLVKLTQGTSALEGQAVDLATRQQMIQRTIHELLAGSSRRLWAP